MSGRRPEPPVGEPDYRYTLANERTFLAWVRTSLGLLAGGVVVTQLDLSGGAGVAGALLAGCCILLAAGLGVGAYVRHRQVRTAMQVGAALPRSGLVPVLGAGVAVVAALCAVLVLVG